MGDFQGSQAFAHITGGNESVNRNTGSFDYSVALVELRGVVQAVDLTLSLTYSSGIAGNFGLPQNWSFGIAYVVPNKSVTSRARTYVIDQQWADATGYHSGLKYINNHGMLFKRQNPPLSLPSGKPGQYGWSFRYTDGAVDYFDVVGKLLEHDDIHSNYIYYSYVDSESSPQKARLAFIQDSWGQKINFGYEAGSTIYITGPNDDKITISYGKTGVSQIQFPLGVSTSIQYQNFASRTVMNHIKYSTGLQTALQYQTLDYLDSSGTSQKLPAIQDHVHLDVQGKNLSRTNYRFGTASSGHTFTGYAVQARMGGTTDGLMESGKTAYEYDTLVSNMDAGGKRISVTRIMFNYLHLPTVENLYAIDGVGNIVDAFRNVKTYVIDPNLHARTPNYTSPRTVEYSNWIPTTQTWNKLRQATARSDNYGCIEYSDQWLSSKNSAYQLQQSKSCKFVPTNWGGEMLRSETYKDEITGVEKQLIYDLTDDQKNVSAITTSIKPAGASDFSPWKVKTSTYDTQGRIKTEIVAWVKPSSAPIDSVLSYTNSNAYTYDASSSYLVIAATDPQGKVTKSTYATKIRRGPLVEKVLPLGQKETFTYDVLGRREVHTDALNHTTTLTYRFDPNENSIASLASNGYRLKYILDALGRRVQLLDNGNSPESSPSDPTRTVYTKTYDSISRITSQKDGAGLLTRYNAYDAFNRVLLITDPDGNKATNTYNDINLDMTNYINGSLRAKTQLDGFNRKVSASRYPDDSDSSIRYCVTETFQYNGFGKVSQIEHHQQTLDHKDSTLLSTATRKFDIEGNIEQEIVRSKSDVGSAAYDTVQRDFTRDIFGLIYTHLKATTYSDGRKFTHKAGIDVYDSCRLLVHYRNELGQNETYTYDDNGWKASMSRFDRTITWYTHDDLGRLKTVRDSAETTTRDYYSNDRLASISVVAQGSSTTNSVKYGYSLDGSAISVTYPDGRTNLYGLDNFGRVHTQTDTLGVQRVIVFNTEGHVASRSIGKDSVTYTYGTANHTQGQLKYDVTTGTQEQKRTLDYDGFGRTSQVTVTDLKTSKVLLSSQYQYNTQNRLHTTKMSSSAPASRELNCSKTFSYDGFGQLITEEIAYTDGTKDTVTYVYDGNCNILSKTHNGSTTNRTYNLLGQRIDAGFDYDGNGRMRKDDKGRTYDYFPSDRLKSSSGDAFEYHPDGSLAVSSESGGKNAFHYDNGTVNAVSTTKGSKSYLLEPGRRLAAFDSDSKALEIYVENNGSTVLAATSSGTEIHQYDAYGSPKDSRGEMFGYRQEFTETSSGLIYLRSRFYHPDHAAFITMDASKKENRYAYCGGDPINRSDITGQAAGGPIAAGIITSAIVTMLLGALTTNLATFYLGEGSLVGAISSAAISGAAGNVAGEAAAEGAAHAKISGESLGIAALAGAVGGAVGAGSGGAAGQYAMVVAEPSIQEVENVTRIGTAVSSVVGGGTGALSAGGVESAMNHRPYFSGDNALGFVTGVVGGAGGALVGSMSLWGLTARFGQVKVLPIRVTQTTFDTDNFVAEIHSQLDDDGRPIPEGRKWVRFLPAHSLLDDMYALGDRPMSDFHRVGNELLDVFDLHGGRRDFFPAMNRTVNGVKTEVIRPMKAKHFALVMKDLQRQTGFGTNGAVKGVSCYAAHSNAQIVADALQTSVFASYHEVSTMTTEGWVRFNPKTP